MNSKDIEKVCIFRDIKHFETLTKDKVIKNKDKQLNKVGVDIYVIDIKTYEYKSFIDIKPSIKYNYRKQYYFELYTEYPNGNRIKSWALEPGISDRHYIAFTDQYRATLFLKSRLVEVLKEFIKNNPGEIKSCNDKDYNGNSCIKKYCLIGFNRNNKYLELLKPFIYDILPTEKEGQLMSNKELKNFYSDVEKLRAAIKNNDEEGFKKYFDIITNNSSISLLERLQYTILDKEFNSFLKDHVEE